MSILFAANPFTSAYLGSDPFGKVIFWMLFLLSAAAWTLLLQKAWMFWNVRALSHAFRESFSEKDPLSLQFGKPLQGKSLQTPHPLFSLYKAGKKRALLLVQKNHELYPSLSSHLSSEDLDSVSMTLSGEMGMLAKSLDKNLYLLPTIVTLAPFVGLLGTVWGILLTFSNLQGKGIALNNQEMLGGFSLALATTVLGLLIAIPALLGHALLKNQSREEKLSMEQFAGNFLSSLELHYKKGSDAKETLLSSS